jgi:hypothetical protein
MPVTPAAFDAPEAVAARAEIDALKSDREFFKQLNAERDRGQAGAALQRWTALHRTGWPSDRPNEPGPAPQVVEQAHAERIIYWKQFADLTPENEAQIRKGEAYINEIERAQADKQRFLQDREWYQRFKAGDRVARSQWAWVQILLSCRPIQAVPR